MEWNWYALFLFVIRGQRKVGVEVTNRYIDICSKLRPTDSDVAALGPDFQKDWDRDFADKPTKPLSMSPAPISSSSSNLVL